MTDLRSIWRSARRLTTRDPRPSTARLLATLVVLMGAPTLLSAQGTPARPTSGGSSSAAYSTADTLGAHIPLVGAADRDRLTFRRELYTYSSGARRDPFASLMSTDELRPLVSDLRLVAVAWDASGSSTVAILRDTQTNEQYRAKVGQLLGRLRVTSIARKSITFTIEEFGFSRQETLSLGDSNNQRTQQ